MTDKKMTITTDDAVRPIVDGVPAVSAADFELLIADVLAEEDDETDAPIADEEEDGAMYREAFAKAEERVRAREAEALDQAAAGSRVSSEIPDEYRWDVGDPYRGPLGEAGPGKA